MVGTTRSAAMVAALVAGFSGTAVRAADTGYVATLGRATPQDRFVAHGLLWRCAQTRCVAPAGNSRAATVCEALAKEVGRLDSFTSGSAALDSDRLAQCNAAARAPRTIAAQ